MTFLQNKMIPKIFLDFWLTILDEVFEMFSQLNCSFCWDSRHSEKSFSWLYFSIHNWYQGRHSMLLLDKSRLLSLFRTTPGQWSDIEHYKWHSKSFETLEMTVNQWQRGSCLFTSAKQNCFLKSSILNGQFIKK